MSIQTKSILNRILGIIFGVLIFAGFFASCNYFIFDVTELFSELYKEDETDLTDTQLRKMMELEALAFEGVIVDVIFKKEKPELGEVFIITGQNHPEFPAKNESFKPFQKFGFSQVDDFFGIPNDSDPGGDVSVWLYPLVDGKVVYHHSGPFDGLRLQYSSLRNTVASQEIFRNVAMTFLEELDVELYFENEQINSFSPVQFRLDEIVVYCRSQLEVEPGSTEALRLDW